MSENKIKSKFDRGGRRPRTCWQLKDGEGPEMMSLWVPKHLAKRVKEFAQRLDRGEID